MLDCIVIDGRSAESVRYNECGYALPPAIFDLKRLLHQSGPNRLLDPTYVQDFILLDCANNKGSLGGENMCSSLTCAAYDGDKYPSRGPLELQSGEAEEDIYCAYETVSMLYDILEPMTNLESLEWTSKAPFVEEFKLGPELAKSHTVGALMGRRKTLKHLKLGFDMVLYCAILPFIVTLESIHLDVSIAWGEYTLEEWVSGKEVSQCDVGLESVYELDEGFSPDWDQIRKEYGPGPINFLLVFLDRNKNLKRLVSSIPNFFTLPCNLPFWAILDVDVIRLEEIDLGRVEVKEAAFCQAAMSLKPALFTMYQSRIVQGGQTLRAEDVEMAINTERVLRPFRSWCLQDSTLAQKTADKFNWRFCHKL